MKLSEIKNVFDVKEEVKASCEGTRGTPDSETTYKGGDGGVGVDLEDFEEDEERKMERDVKEFLGVDDDGDDYDRDDGGKDEEGGDDEDEGYKESPAPAPDEFGDDELDREDEKDAEEIRKATEALEKMKEEMAKRKEQRDGQRGKAVEKLNDLEKRVESLETFAESQTIVNTTVTQRIEEMNEELKKAVGAKGRTKKIKVEDLPTVEVETPHNCLEKVLRIVAVGAKPFLCGKAGGGKSTLAKQVAECLHLPFRSLVISIDTTVQELVGYVSAIDGKYRTTPIRDAFENGGVLLLDEFDSASPDVLTCLNNLIENDVYTFPDGNVVKRHCNLRIMAAGNTNGSGANYTYNGRQKLDGATLDRFVIVNVPYDEELEKKICGNEYVAECVQSVRKAVDSLGYENIIISPRASIQGALLMASGLSLDEVLDLTIFNKITDKTIAKRIKNTMVLPPPKE